MISLLSKCTTWALGALLLLALGGSVAQAQNNRRNFCATDEQQRVLEQANPQLVIERQKLDAEIQRFLAHQASNPSAERNGRASRIIPTVVHIIHEYGGENFSKADVLLTIDQLNKDMMRRNSDTNTPRRTFQNVAGDLDMEFRLATLDPDGNPTDGITRIEHPYTVAPATRDSVKSVRSWNTTRYFNIWIIRSIATTTSGTILGYAQFPLGSPNGWGTWGVVMIADEATSRTSRTLSHEVGHCFNLYHTFQGGCGSNCSTTGDQVCDTPPVLDDTYTCNTTQNTCSNDNPNQVDMIENYMSYDNCQNMWTRGQGARVNAAIASVANLRNLFSPNNLIATGTDDATFSNPAPTIPVAAFGATVSSVCVGTSVDIRDGSYNGTVDNTWEYTYIVPGTAQGVFRGFGNAARNISVVFTTPGRHEIKQIVRNAAGADSVSRILFTVRPSTARIAVPLATTYRQEFNFSNLNNDPDEFKNFYVEGAWALADVSSPSGNPASKSIRVPNNGTGVVAGRPRYLYTPAINISALTTGAKLYFYRALARRTSVATDDELTIEQSTNCGNSWSTPRLTRNMTSANLLYTTSQVFSGRSWTPTSADWRLDSMPIIATGSARQNVQFRFNMVASNAHALFLDDIQIGFPFNRNITSNRLQLSGTCASCAGLEIVPNPANASAVIEVENGAVGNKLYVLDAAGRLVAQKTLTEVGSQILELQNLAPGIRSGVYILRLEHAKGNVVRRMVVSE